jgi:hypothetical protein
MTLSLRPATAEDRPRIRRWLALPAARSWVGDAPGAEARVILAMGSAAALCRVVEEAAVPIGYGHAAEAALWAGSLPAVVAPGTWELELFIAAPAKTHPAPADVAPAGAGEAAGAALGETPQPARRPCAAEALALLADEVFATTLAIACCGLVPVTHEAAVRAYERAHFRWQRIWNDPVRGPTWVMLRERPH